MNENHVVVYSNGIADFQRCYRVGADSTQPISIPVRQDHLADVLASFNVYGSVKLETPPTFRPANELEGNLSIDPQNVLEQLSRNLSGANVRVDRASGAIEGKLVGLQQEDEVTSAGRISRMSLVVLTQDGLRRCQFGDIQNYQFLDQDVQVEIDKALQKNFQRIKPNSTFVELGLRALSEETEAIVQYTIPASAWKISYRLRLAEDRVSELQGFAVVDNNTDEDWNDFRVSVVTGEPITFSTDLAESKTPARSHVDLVSESALGAVEVESSFGLAAPAMGFQEADDDGTGEQLNMAMRMASPAYRLKNMGAETASTSAAEVTDVGDFNMFTSDSLVTIPAKRSAVIPVFNVEVAETKTVVHYKYENHPERPFRSVDFTNQADFSLGRGVCTVFVEGAYSGNCILPALKPGESRLLPHALETGMTVRRDQKQIRTKTVALRLAAGFCYTSSRQRGECHYYINNSRDESYRLILDHDYTLSEPDIEATLLIEESTEPLVDAERYGDGTRYTIEVGPQASLVVKIVEQRIDESRVALVTRSKQREKFNIDWLLQNVVQTNGPLASDEGIQACFALHQSMEDKRQEIADAESETDRLARRQQRLRENIKSGGQDDLSARWRTELDEAEQSIRNIEEERLPALRHEERALNAQLLDAMKSLSAEWSQDEH